MGKSIVPRGAYRETRWIDAELRDLGESLGVWRPSRQGRPIAGIRVA